MGRLLATLRALGLALGLIAASAMPAHAGPLINPFSVTPAAAGVTPSAFVVGVDTSGVSTSSFNYNATSLTPGEPLLILVYGMSTLTASARSISSLTSSDGAVALISAHTSAVSSRPFGAYVVTGISGTSATITVTFSSTMQHCYMGHVRLSGTAQSTYHSRTGAAPNSAGTVTAATSTPGITVPSGGIGVGIMVSLNSTLDVTHTADVGSAVEQDEHTLIASGSSANSARVGYSIFTNTSATAFTATTSTTSSKWTTAFSWAP